MFKELFSLFAVFIALFLFGMIIMRAGLLPLGGKLFERNVHRFTDKAWKGLLIGTVATALLQSSSVVLVMTVGLVAANVLTFRQSIGIILGANIGTTITTEIIAFDLSYLIFPLLISGFIFLFIPNKKSFHIGCATFGLACIFIAMDGLESLAYPLATLPSVHTLFEFTNEHTLVGVIIGASLTGLVQSSTATTAIAMGFMNDHLLTLKSGIAIMFGANIGTCITAFLATIGAGKHAKLVAFANIWLNLIGVVIFLPMMDFLVQIATSLTDDSMQQLAHTSVIFNTVCSIALLPFATMFARGIERMHLKRESY
ncbi:Na/Pi symporter [Bacillus sp. FJAT-45037]|uniref:Na/Pi symporter n=1 Tax=Bacillus sp. FJAT-45037 TaxID=2011007 RepID=UPI000C232929|nr:Na/Pi symporter [Bacillus sp. FJAT-45037]